MLVCFSTAELLLMICSHLSSSDLRRFCQVSKFLNERLQGLAWSEVHMGFLRLLSEGRQGETPENGWTFDRDPSCAEWDQFLTMTPKVVRFKDWPKTTSFRLSSSSETSVAVTRPLQPIFNNLRELHTQTRSFNRVFMSSSVTILHWNVDSVPSTSTQIVSFGDTVTHIMPFLHTLLLEFKDIESIGRLLEDILPELHGLTKITFPLYGLTRSILIVIAELRYLRDVHLQFTTDMTNHTQPSTTSINGFTLGALDLPAGAFPELRGLSLSCPSIDCATATVSTPPFPLSNLTRLFLRVPSAAGTKADDIRSALRTLRDGATMLDDLTLNLIPSEGHPIAEIWTTEPLELQHLSVLAEFVSLRSFTIQHTFPLNFSLEDMDDFARSLPKIERLILNHHPMLFRPIRISITALESFARNCPMLKELGILVDGTLAVSAMPKKIFSSRFEVLRFGRTAFPSTRHERLCRPLSRYLGLILPKRIIVHSLLTETCMDWRYHVSLSGHEPIAPMHATFSVLMDSALRDVLTLCELVQMMRSAVCFRRDGLRGRLRELRMETGVGDTEE